MNGPFWITKYALSDGIQKQGSGNVNEYDGKKWVSYGSYSILKIGRDAFSNEADAKADAEVRRQKKIASLKKQIAKLEKLTF